MRRLVCRIRLTPGRIIMRWMKRIAIKKSRELPEAPAGEFSQWLRHTRNARQARDIGANVPCYGCTACCRSSVFIHIRADETRSLKRIPEQLLLPVPGLAKGHRLMGYDEKGHCPRLVNDRLRLPHFCRNWSHARRKSAGWNFRAGKGLAVHLCRRSGGYGPVPACMAYAGPPVTGRGQAFAGSVRAKAF